MKRKKIIGLLLTVMTAAVLWAKAPWSIFGVATAVKQGAPPNPWAIQLTSTCPSFPSPTCLGDGSLTFGGIAFQQPNGKLTFAQIQQLSADFNRTDDDCGGGSPRFQINIDMNGDGVFTQPPDGNVFVYFGPLPSFTGCGAGWLSTGNLIGLPNSETRYDASQVGGGVVTNYSSTLALVGDKAVLGVQVVVDSGWNAAATGGDGEQTVLVDNIRVNNYQLTANGFSKQ